MEKTVPGQCRRRRMRSTGVRRIATVEGGHGNGRLVRRNLLAHVCCSSTEVGLHVVSVSTLGINIADWYWPWGQDRYIHNVEKKNNTGVGSK